ncbi:ThuA domain-containing protein [Kineosporia sp. J2-2]|uniref:ThuA domain-containing protein n=1 Tax=Kineosporia corallincola TaxID=2835133 RepID=A0ABS5TDI2_9ACTN|nr:ThuA domain-containing protein [Kineosporia corallincola]MBT0769120.1 ThuA domain-containing protein [Kineosporia corallincola]
MNATKRALIVRGGWEGHQPVAATALFIPFLENSGYQVEIADKPAVYADAALMSSIDLVVQCMTMSTIEKPEVRGLREAVAAGTGLAGWHGGIADSYRDSADYLQLIGGQFACHPGRHPDERTGAPDDNFIPYRVDITAPDHPITAGIEPFDLFTEQYWVLSDAYDEVLATTTLAAQPWNEWSRPVTSPAVWTRQWGAGRVFVATPGHAPDVLEVPQVRTIIERGLLWASR